MLRNLIIWISVFALSFLVGLTGLVSQSTAFMWIYIGLIPILLILLVIVGFEGFTNKIMGIVLILVGLVIMLIFPMALSWLISRIFELKFSIAFEILTFITCFLYAEPRD